MKNYAMYKFENPDPKHPKGGMKWLVRGLDCVKRSPPKFTRRLTEFTYMYIADYIMTKKRTFEQLEDALEVELRRLKLTRYSMDGIRDDLLAKVIGVQAGAVTMSELVDSIRRALMPFESEGEHHTNLMNAIIEGKDSLSNLSSMGGLGLRSGEQEGVIDTTISVELSLFERLTAQIVASTTELRKLQLPLDELRQSAELKGQGTYKGNPMSAPAFAVAAAIAKNTPGLAPLTGERVYWIHCDVGPGGKASRRWTDVATVEREPTLHNIDIGHYFDKSVLLSIANLLATVNLSKANDWVRRQRTAFGLSAKTSSELKLLSDTLIVQGICTLSSQIINIDMLVFTLFVDYSRCLLIGDWTINLFLSCAGRAGGGGYRVMAQAKPLSITTARLVGKRG